MVDPFTFLSRFGFSKKKAPSVLGVDIGSSSIKLVQLRRERGGAILETYGELALGPYGNLEVGQATNLPPAKIAEALADLLREANTTTTEAAVSVPFSASLVSLMELPPLPAAELAKMIPLEARRYIPVPISEVSLDWFIIPRTAETPPDEKELQKKTLVLLVAIHNEVLNAYREIVKAANLSTQFFEIEIFSAIRGVTSGGLAPFVVMDLGASSTKLYVVEYGVVRMTHLIRRGGQDITLAISRSLNMSVKKAEELKRSVGLSPGPQEEHVAESTRLVLEYVFAEANRVILGYEKKFNQNVNKIVLVGGGAALKGIKELAGKHTSVEIELGDPFSKLETPAFLEEVLRDAGPTFAVSTGLALRQLQDKE